MIEKWPLIVGSRLLSELYVLARQGSVCLQKQVFAISLGQLIDFVHTEHET